MPGLLVCVSYLFLSSLQSRYVSSLKEFFLFVYFTEFDMDFFLIKKNINYIYLIKYII